MLNEKAIIQPLLYVLS